MIECIPNFSEGQRPEVVDAIGQTISAVPGVYLLDTHIDADHNRSVITFAGLPEPVAEAAFRAVEAAALLIDMNRHQGQHPRVGSTDVLPFVPLDGATIEQCAELARTVGKRIGEALDIPVYLYGAAAARPERRELPRLRTGQYEGLREAIRRDPAWTPDFGPSYLGTAGATVVGARPPLIAYNLYLNTDDVAIAKRIARAVRGSSGGLRGVRALGLLVGGRAQVSMNLVDYRSTAVHRAVALVAHEAKAYGVAITAGELVGLIPEDALIDAGRSTLRLPTLTNGQILERRLNQVITQVDDRRSNNTPYQTAQLSTQNSVTATNRFTELQHMTNAKPLDALWAYNVQALAAAVRELAESEATGRVRAMLRALGRELVELAGDESDEYIAPRIHALLLIARRAIKATETVALASQNGRSARVLTLVNLAYSVATTARLRALELLPQIDIRQRQALEHEFASYAATARELLFQLDAVA